MCAIVAAWCAPPPDTELFPPAPIADYAIATVWTPESIEAEARRVAREYHLDDRFVETMRDESAGFTWNDQSLVAADGPNGREDSWGICQIHLPSWPEVSKSEALDPAFCLRWSAQRFAEGNADKWSAYRALSNDGP